MIVAAALRRTASTRKSLATDLNQSTLQSKINRAISVLAVLFVLVIVSMSASAQVAAVSKLKIKSNVLGEDRPILVRTPPGYEANKRAYPVLYLTDGDTHLAHTSSTIEFLARNGRMSEMIVVGIPNTDRARDLTPVKATGPGAAQFPTGGGADNFLKFIETELIPEIEKTYRVQPYRVLAGHSLGGLFAIHALISRPELFNAYIAVSPSLQWSDEATLKRAEEFLKTRKELHATLFTSLGDERGDIGKDFELFKGLLAKSQIKGFEWEAEQMKDEDHGSVVLRSHYVGLRKVYEGWQMPRDPETGAVAGGLKAADEHYKWLSQKFGYSIPTPEVLINQIGYEFLGEKPEEAIAAFKANVERYPDSANVYDSLGEAYEKGGRIDLATPLYEKAQSLSRQYNDPNAAIYAANFTRASDKLKQAAAAKSTDASKAVDAAKKNQ
jgi:predicted alpha/beta superfamily hydrolase